MKQAVKTETTITWQQRDIYRSELAKLVALMKRTASSCFSDFARVVTLVMMNMRYERVAFASSLNRHPYLLTRDIIRDARRQYMWFMDMDFIKAGDQAGRKNKSNILKEKHKELWQEIWPRHSDEEFQEFVDLKVKRFKINALEPYIAGKDCVEFGCGNGAIVFALLELGARSAAGIDFGPKSIEYARAMAIKRGVAQRTEFTVDDIVRTRLPSNHYDFAVSNGVFHHLDVGEVKQAVSEVARVLKPGGWLWYYVDGKNAISMDLWDASVEVLRGVKVLFIEKILKDMSISRNKMVFIVDGLSAIYLHSTWQEVVNLLAEYGFGEFRRLKGGVNTDFDLDVVDKDPYGQEKFGEGDIRVLCQLLQL